MRTDLNFAETESVTCSLKLWATSSFEPRKKCRISDNQVNFNSQFLNLATGLRERAEYLHCLQPLQTVKIV